MTCGHGAVTPLSAGNTGEVGVLSAGNSGAIEALSCCDDGPIQPPVIGTYYGYIRFDDFVFSWPIAGSWFTGEADPTRVFALTPGGGGGTFNPIGPVSPAPPPDGGGGAIVEM